MALFSCLPILDIFAAEVRWLVQIEIVYRSYQLKNEISLTQTSRGEERHWESSGFGSGCTEMLY
jgi:hypothetical protein